MHSIGRILQVLVVLTLTGHGATGQALVNDNALITITTNTRVTILGGALNNGDLINQGHLSLSGDWMNVDFYDPGNGLFTLDGTSAQRIAPNGHDVFQLQILGSGEKIFSSDMQVQDSLALVEGILTPEAGVTILVQNGAEVSGGSPSSFINGAIFHEGNGYKYFPVGKNGNFRPAELMNVTGTNPILGFEVFEPNNSPQVPFNLLTVSDTRYWQLTARSGAYNGSLVRLKLGSDENLGSDPALQDLAVTSSDALGSIFFSLGQSQFAGSLLDGEVVSALPAISEFYALGVEGFVEERTLYVPNALSLAAPNPEDRVIKVYGEQIIDEDFMFRIYNRWGQVVYETDSFNEANTVGWQGNTASGKDEIIGVYHYTVSGRFASGNRFQRNGSITVIR